MRFSLPFAVPRLLAVALVGAFCVLTGAPMRAAEAAATPSGIAKFQIVSPFLLPAFATTPGQLDLAGYLANPAAQAAAQARGLAADDTSEAVVVFRTILDRPVRFSAPGGVLTPYRDDFLTHAPAAGGETLTVRPSNFIVVNGRRYAAALLRASGPVSSLRVTAGHGYGLDPSLTLPVVPPPVILVHGLWGDATSLASTRDALQATAPWNGANSIVAAIEYPNYLPFDHDDLWGTLETNIDSAIAALDAAQIVGGRVDVVAHSMGGLVSRVYSTKTSYRTPHDRNLGRFRQLITLVSPEAGSPLADFLLAHRDDVQSVFDGVPGLVWSILCDGGASVPKTMEQCLEAAGMPIVPPGDPEADGAVASLSPTSPNMQAIASVSPKIDGSLWQAVQSQVDDSGGCDNAGRTAHALVYLLNCFIAGTANSATIGGTIGAPNDGIVAAPSQIAGGAPDHVVSLTTQNLAHTDPTVPFLFGHPTGFVTQSDLVNDTVACWLADSGDDCAAVGVAAARVAKATTAAPTPFLTRRLVVDRPSAATAGTPLVLTGRGVTAGLARLVVQQRDEAGRVGKAVEAKLVATADGVVRAEIDPVFLGNVRLAVWAVYADGGIAMQRFVVPVAAPDAPLRSLRGDPNFDTLVLSRIGGRYRLDPAVRYGAAAPVRLGRYAAMHVVAGGAQPAVALASDGTLTALRPGADTVELRFGGAVSRLRVLVGSGR